MNIYQKKIKTVICLVVCCFIIVCSFGIKAKADEATIDASKTTPYSFTIAADKSGMQAPMSFPKAGVYTIKIEVTNFDKEIIMTQVSDYTNMDVKNVRSKEGSELTFTTIVTEPETRYYVLYSKNPPALEKNIKITFSYDTPETEGRDIKEGEEVRAVGMDDLYYSIKLTGDKKITITSDSTVVLCDSKKESLGVVAYKDKPATTYLKKGTYYLSVSKGITTFKYTTKKATLGKNTTKKKAKTVKLGKTIKTKIYAANKNKSTQYYKFTLKKAKKISVTADASKISNMGTLNINIYKKKANKAPYMSGNICEKKGKVEFTGEAKNSIEGMFLNKKSVKLPAGTYYMEVQSTEGGDVSFMIK